MYDKMMKMMTNDVMIKKYASINQTIQQTCTYHPYLKHTMYGYLIETVFFHVLKQYEAFIIKEWRTIVFLHSFQNMLPLITETNCECCRQ